MTEYLHTYISRLAFLLFFYLLPFFSPATLGFFLFFPLHLRLFTDLPLVLGGLFHIAFCTFTFHLFFFSVYCFTLP